jgi:hypothetical protein
MSEHMRLAEEQQTAVTELFDSYKRELKQDPTPLIHEVMTLKQTQYALSGIAKSYDELKQHADPIGYAIEKVFHPKPVISPLQIAKYDREIALIELAMAATKQDSDPSAAKLLLEDAQVRRKEAQELAPEIQTDAALERLQSHISDR